MTFEQWLSQNIWIAGLEVEAAKFAYAAGRQAALEDTAKVCHEAMLKSPGAGEAIGLAIVEQTIRSMK